MVRNGVGCPCGYFVQGLPLLWGGWRVGGLRLRMVRRAVAWAVLQRQFRWPLRGVLNGVGRGRWRGDLVGRLLLWLVRRRGLVAKPGDGHEVCKGVGGGRRDEKWR